MMTSILPVKEKISNRISSKRSQKQPHGEASTDLVPLFDNKTSDQPMTRTQPQPDYIDAEWFEDDEESFVSLLPWKLYKKVLSLHSAMIPYIDRYV